MEEVSESELRKKYDAIQLAELAAAYTEMLPENTSKEILQSVIAGKCEKYALVGLKAVFVGLPPVDPLRNLFKEHINTKLADAINKAIDTKEISRVFDLIAGIHSDDISGENKKALEEKATMFLINKIGDIKTLDDLKSVRADVLKYSQQGYANKSVNSLFDEKLKGVFDEQKALLENPDTTLDQKLLIYKRAVESGLFSDDDKTLLKASFIEQVKKQIAQKEPDIFAIRLCVKELNDGNLSSAYEQKLKVLASEVTPDSAIKALEKIDSDKKLTAVEKAEKIDGLVATYLFLHNSVPKALQQKYKELSEKYVHEIVSDVGQYSAKLFTDLDVDKMQSQAFNPDKSSRQPLTATDASKPLTAGFNSISNNAIKSILANKDFNAGLLATKRWIEIASQMYLKGNFFAAKALLGVFGNASLAPYMNIINNNTEHKLHLALLNDVQLCLAEASSFKSMRASEAVTDDPARSIPFLGYKNTDMTFTYDGNDPKGGIDKRAFLLEPIYNEFRTKQRALDEAPKKSLTDTFGSKAEQKLEERDADTYKKMIDANKGDSKPTELQSDVAKKTKDPLSKKKKAVEKYQAPDKKTISKEEQQKTSVAYNMHIAKNGGFSKDFYNSPEYKDRETLHAAVTEYMRSNPEAKGDFYFNPQNKDYANFTAQREYAKRNPDVKGDLSKNEDFAKFTQAYKSYIDANQGNIAKQTSSKDFFASQQHADYILALESKKEAAQEQRASSLATFPKVWGKIHQTSPTTSQPGTPQLGRHKTNSLIQKRNRVDTPPPLSPLPPEEKKENALGDSTANMMRSGQRVPADPPPSKPNDFTDDMEEPNQAQKPAQKPAMTAKEVARIKPPPPPPSAPGKRDSGAPNIILKK